MLTTEIKNKEDLIRFFQDNPSGPLIHHLFYLL